MSEFGIVEDTMFIPMVGRIYATEKFPGILYDKKALSLKEKLPSALLETGNQSQYTLLASASRSANMDRHIQNFLKRNGSLFLQWNCPAEDGLNRIIYGHNMNSGAMFGNLEQYEDAAFLAAHRNVFFQTEKGLEEYTVVSVLKTDIRKFPFTKVDFPDEVSLKEYVERAKSQELFETGENVADCHTVLTLVTCAYEWDGARTVVIAVR